MKIHSTKSILYLTVLLFITEVLIALLLPRFVRSYLGDVLVVILLIVL